MPKKCPDGVFCIENYTMFFLFLIGCGILYYLINYKPNTSRTVSNNIPSLSMPSLSMPSLSMPSIPSLSMPILSTYLYATYKYNINECFIIENKRIIPIKNNNEHFFKKFLLKNNQLIFLGSKNVNQLFPKMISLLNFVLSKLLKKRH